MDESHQRRWNFWHWLVLAVVAYVVPLIIIAVDVGCGSRLLPLLGPEVEHFLEILYWPVTVVIEYVINRRAGL